MVEKLRFFFNPEINKHFLAKGKRTRMSSAKSRRAIRARFKSAAKRSHQNELAAHAPKNRTGARATNV